MKRELGLTLLELLIVIVIISVIVGMLVPSIGNSKRQNIEAVERAVLLINMARQEALLSSKVWQFVFDIEDKQYYFQQLTGMEFEDILRQPLAGRHQIEELSVMSLKINGQEIPSGHAAAYLFPTGENDSLRLVFKSEQNEYLIGMNVFNSAWMEEL